MDITYIGSFFIVLHKKDIQDFYNFYNNSRGNKDYLWIPTLVYQQGDYYKIFYNNLPILTVENGGYVHNYIDYSFIYKLCKTFDGLFTFTKHDERFYELVQAQDLLHVSNKVEMNFHIEETLSFQVEQHNIPNLKGFNHVDLKDYDMLCLMSNEMYLNFIDKMKLNNTYDDYKTKQKFKAHIEDHVFLCTESLTDANVLRTFLDDQNSFIFNNDGFDDTSDDEDIVINNKHSFIFFYTLQEYIVKPNGKDIRIDSKEFFKTYNQAFIKEEI
jgi:hypothetical protein